MGILVLTPLTDGTLAKHEPLQKFICVHHNGETYVTWNRNKDEAKQECTEKSQYGKPWKVLAYPSWID